MEKMNQINNKPKVIKKEFKENLNAKPHVFENLAIFDEQRQTSNSGVTIPTTKGVVEAREWVNENEK